TEWFAETGTLPAHPRDLVSGLTERYLRERLVMRPPRAEFTYPTCVAGLETLAGQLLDSANDAGTEIDEANAVELLAAHTEQPQELLNLLVGAELISRSGSAVRFHHRAFQQYFAAMVQRHHDEAALVRRLLSYRGRDALEDMIRFADGSAELTHLLIEPALAADPIFAAQLLRWTENPGHEDVARFLAGQERALFSRDGEHAWSTAVNALFTLGTDDARLLLHLVTRSDDADPFARSAALAGLLRMRGATPVDQRRPSADQDLTETVRRLLELPVQDLRVRAINAVVDGRVRPLVAYLASMLDERQPWPVLRAARRSLASLDQILAPVQQATYLDACARRLPECERERRSAVDSGMVEELQDERWELIEVLSRAGRLDLVLPARFSTEPSEHYFWSERRRLTTASRDEVPENTRAAWDVLHADLSPPELVDRFDAGDDLVAVAAAHRLLADHSGWAQALVGLVSADSSAVKLLAVAETVPYLDDDGLARLRSIVTELIGTMPVDRLEPLAALLGSLPANKRSTRRLTLQMMVRLRQLRPGVVHGPLERVFAQSPRWSDAEVSQVAVSGDAGCELVRQGLSLVLYANDARTLTPVTLTPKAAEALLERRPVDPADRVTLVRAGTTAGLVEVLPEAFVAASDPGTAQLHHLPCHPKYGVETVNRLGEMLTCIGYLARLAHQRGAVDQGERAHSFLQAFDTSGLDRTVERGRLLGLAVLGDWSPLLRALWSGDRPMHRAARNAVLAWRSGPFTPGWGSDDLSVARHLGERLAGNDPALAPDVRSTLAEIKTLVERRIGRIILPD
ncbi:MAG TPA: hypothetical protein VF163_20025, partial [Micromonosporaceae bacterium]